MRWLPLLIMLLLCGCDIRPLNEPKADEASLAAARRMDTIDMLIEQGRIADARRELDAALADGFEHPRAFMLKGRLLAHDDSASAAKAAVPWFEKAIAASPSWFAPRFELAQAHIRAGELDSAAAVVDGIERLVPEHAAGPYARGVIARLRGRNAEAEELFAEALVRDPDYQPALLQAMVMARQAGDRDREREYLSRLLSKHGEDADMHRRLGELDEADGRLADAERAYRLSYRLQPDPRTARRLADLAKQQGDQVMAEEWLRRSEGR